MYKLDNFKYPSTDLGLQRPGAASERSDGAPLARRWLPAAHQRRSLGQSIPVCFPGNTRPGIRSLSPSEPTARKAAKAKMPTLETGISTSSPLRAGRGRSRGFTLMEIMVVVAIIGLVTAVTVIIVRRQPRDTELDEEAERLDALFSYVREQAELQTRDYGFRINDRNYSFVVFDVLGDQWRPVEEDDALREREFPEGIEPQRRGRGPRRGARQPQEGRSRISRRRSSFSPTATCPPSKCPCSARAAKTPRAWRASTPTNRPTSACCCPAKSEQTGSAGTHRGGTMNRRTPPHRTRRGFTLLEVLIALAIVALSAGALLGTITSSASNVAYLQDKTLAEWVALNRLTEIRIAQQMPDDRQTHRQRRDGRHALAMGRRSHRDAAGEGTVSRRRARPAHRRDRR